MHTEIAFVNTALAPIDSACELKDALGCALLADLYLDGNLYGLTADPVRASKLFEFACGEGEADPRSASAGAALFGRACEETIGKRASLSAWPSVNGNGLARDYEGSSKLATAMCRQDAISCVDLAIHCLFRQGVERSERKAYQLLMRRYDELADESRIESDPWCFAKAMSACHLSRHLFGKPLVMPSGESWQPMFRAVSGMILLADPARPKR